jgi:two-component system sensor kinase FixL
MSNTDSEKNNFLKLRKAAEKKLNKNKLDLKPGKDSELGLYKIELELQNEELLATQQKLLSSINEYTELFEFAPIGYFILDINGVILKVNETGCKQLGVSKSKLLNKYFSTFIKHKSCQDRFYLYKNLTIDSGKKQQMECKLINQKGTPFYGLVESIKVLDEYKKFKFLLCTIVDISAQKKHEDLLEIALKKEIKLNELKSQFISIASHEFRTPLSTILTSAELIERYNKIEDEEKKEKHYYKIKTSVNRIKEILVDFLSADQIQKGDKKNNPKIFNLIDFMESVILETKSFNELHSVKYKHIGQNQNIFLDETLLKTCVSNIIINAYKYSPKGGNINIKTEQKKTGSITIEITDEGIGIPASNESNIFEQFFRGKNTSNIQGTGLGLSITKKLVNLMGGEISFKSKENIGTTFTIKFGTKIEPKREMKTGKIN